MSSQDSAPSTPAFTPPPIDDPDFAMGGQAVLEGVMMRGPKAYAVAVRRPQGDITTIRHPFVPVVKRKRWLGIPIVRGAVSLVEMLLLGYRALDFSANVMEQGFRDMEAQEKGRADASQPDRASTQSADEPPPGTDTPSPSTANPDERPISRWTMAGVFVFSLALAMLLFVALPNAATHLLGQLVWRAPDAVPAAAASATAPAEAQPEATLPAPQATGLVEVHRPLAFNLASGAIRVLVIVGYIWAISLLKDIRRLFQYHGAEHKVVMAYERGLPLDLEHIRPVTTLHPRCGTTFIAIVLLVSILIFAVLAALIVRLYPPFADWSIWARKPLLILLHIVFMPLVGGLAYEITRHAGRRPGNPLARVLLAPGFAFQRITTRQPTDDMIEVALTAFHTCLESPRDTEGADG